MHENTVKNHTLVFQIRILLLLSTVGTRVSISKLNITQQFHKIGRHKNHLHPQLYFQEMRPQNRKRTRSYVTQKLHGSFTESIEF